MPHSRHVPRPLRLPAGMCALVLLLAAGCTPSFYRKQADADAYGLINQKAYWVADPTTNLSIQVDPRSRMFDPFNPDKEPMPPDDPISHRYMHCVDGMRGSLLWHKWGDTPFVENPYWGAYLCLNEDGCLELDANNAVLMALLNSRNYQTQLEELYLSALDVSFERFRFDAQFFAAFQTQYTADGPDRAGIGGESSSELLVGTLPSGADGIRMEKLFASGGELLVGLANEMVWEFSGPDTNSVTTLADFAFVQPFLRGAGRAVVLERLTLAERTLLANVRIMERYRRGFYVEIMTGENAGQGPSRRGGVFGAGLEGFSGVGGGGFGRVGGFGGGDGGFTSGAGAAAAGGYMGLLQEQQNIRNLEFNVVALQNSYLQLKDLAEGNRITQLQVAQTRQALFNAQSRLLTARTSYNSTLDRFKLLLGLPPQLCIEITDPMLDPFNLIDPQMIAAQNEITRLQQEIGSTLIQTLGDDSVQEGEREAAKLPKIDCNDLTTAAKEFAAADKGPLKDVLEDPVEEEPAPAAPPVEWSDDLGAKLQRIVERLNRVEEMRDELLNKRMPAVCRDIKKLEGLIQPRVASLEKLGDRFKEEFSSDARTLVEDIEELKLVPSRLSEDLLRVVSRVDTYRDLIEESRLAIERLIVDGPSLTSEELQRRLDMEIRIPIADRLREFSTDVLEVSLIQARARTESVELIPVDLDSDLAIEIARANRRDWANARANLVDTWRLIRFNANALKAGLDVVLEGDIRNQGDNPLDFRANTGRLRARIEFDAPLTRLAERNAYRQALIEYQQARRNYYAFRDNVARSLRDTLRTIELNQLNFELRRKAVVVAIQQVEQARLRLQEPPKPVEGGGATTQLSDTAARDLVSALTDLLNAQNDFLSVWVNYEVLRRVLDKDLGTMQLTPDGLWIDPGPITAESGFLLPGECPECEIEEEFEMIGPPPPEAYEELPGETVEGAALGEFAAAPKPTTPQRSDAAPHTSAVPVSLGLRVADAGTRRNPPPTAGLNASGSAANVPPSTEAGRKPSSHKPLTVRR